MSALSRRIDPKIARSVSGLLGRGRSKIGSRIGLGVAITDVQVRRGEHYPDRRISSRGYVFFLVKLRTVLFFSLNLESNLRKVPRVSKVSRAHFRNNPQFA